MNERAGSATLAPAGAHDETGMPGWGRVRRAAGMVALVCGLVAAAFALAGCQPAGAVLHGRVTDSTSGTNPAGVSVTLFSSTSDTQVATTVTDSQGDYSFMSKNVPDGTYRVRFSSADWWQGASSWSGATDVVASLASPATIDETLALSPGTISGTVTDGSNGLTGVSVSAIAPSTGSTVATTTSTTGGTYQLPPLPEGSYQVRFSLSGYTTRYSGGATSSATAPLVTVSPGADTAGVGTTLAPQSTISGSVRNGSVGVGNIIVIAYDQASGAPVSLTVSDASGDYQLTGLSASTYVVGFYDQSGTYRNQMWGSDTFSTASGTPIATSTGTDTPLGPEYLTGRDCDPTVYTPGADLSGQNLSGKKLTNCDLTGVDLTGADLTGTDLSGATVTNAVLTDANLTNTDLFDAVGINTTIVGTDQSAGLLSATLTGTNLAGTGLDLTSTDLSGADLAGTNLSGATFNSTNLTGADLTGANLSSSTYLSYATGLATATLTGTDLSNNGQALYQADLHGKDLTGTNLTGDDLTNTNFDSATLTNTVFTDANLTGAKLTNLTGINTTIIGTDTSAGLFSAPLTYADFTGSGLDLHGLNLDLSGKDLSSTNLSGATWPARTCRGRRSTART